jgi:hypothetical protein
MAVVLSHGPADQQHRQHSHFLVVKNSSDARNHYDTRSSRI